MAPVLTPLVRGSAPLLCSAALASLQVEHYPDTLHLSLHTP